MSEKKVYWPVIVAVMTVISMLFFIILLGYFTSSGASVGILRTLMDLQILFRTLMTGFLGKVGLEAVASIGSMGILTNLTGVA